MEIRTNTARLLKAPADDPGAAAGLPLTGTAPPAKRSGNCRLQELALRFGVRHVRFTDTRPRYEMDDTISGHRPGPQQVHPLRRLRPGVRGDAGHGHPELRPPGQRPGGDARPLTASWTRPNCVSCGQCAAACPTGAITILTTRSARAWRGPPRPEEAGGGPDRPGRPGGGGRGLRPGRPA